MYRLYRIYKNEYKKFNFLKRDVVLEKYYLFKSCAYLPYHEINIFSFLYKRIDVIGEATIILDNDPKLSLFDKFFNYLKKNYKIYNLKLNDLIFISSVIKLCYNQEYSEESINQLIYLSNNNNLEAKYKLLCLTETHEDDKDIFEFLYRNKYYRSFLNYALFLYKKGDKNNAMNILKIALKNGYYSVINYYIVIFFELNDFETIMKSPKEKNEFLYIIGCLIDFIIADDIYTLYEYLYIRHICVKHFNFKKEFKEIFGDYTKEIVEFLIKITEGTESENRERIKKYYINNNSYNELYFACGILYYYGIEGILEREYNTSFNKIKIAYDNSDSESYKRYCYNYIYKIKNKIYKQNNNSHDDKKEKEFIEIQHNLFKMYHNGLYEQDVEYLSSSYFYYLSKLYNQKIGNDGDILMEYIFMNRAAKYEGGQKLRLNSFGIYYKRYKAKKKIKEKNKDEYYEKLENIKGYMNNEGYGEDGTICPICYENKKSSICLPCRHLFCPTCLEQLVDKTKCPVCRTIIVLTFDTKTKKEQLMLSKR